MNPQNSFAKSLQNSAVQKTILAFFWGSIISSFFYYSYSHSLGFRDYLPLLRGFVENNGWWGPVLYILLYAIRPIIFFPATLMTALSGVIFGPILGIAYTIIGENLSANVAFLIGRFFGQGFLSGISSTWIKKVNEQMEKNGFMTVLLMRLLYFPFDLTNYAAGMSKIKHKDYALSTFIGIIPGLSIFVLLGGAAGVLLEDGQAAQESNPNQIWWILGASLVTFVFSLVLSKHLKKRNQEFSELKDKA